ncbi:MAG: TetR/AcrR family transcriptional regulator [Atopobiaceae bacterium]|nr:TetR/AcrR family transcriptional regulator [Atopobiaceae bacterium]MCH4120457.1 TetR/AcrR family transcriptional regulator [Atopobiaceae bacterium]MCI1318862.1 TetR/AcrR family transcriptional regulator [Atopobiaceae bacterium]MCI1388295.1 TetR/AcrR family transcriptional regulator [Atopobiaceae bacterium]MCI1431455.1 TetR/AcrR family transcriptional regulator [Atopobiaceae bacterium]
MAALPDNMKVVDADAVADKALTDASVLVKNVRQRVERRREAKTRKSARTRERILEAAHELMVERGNGEFQMAEVSERCNMSKGALYYYFTDRDDIITEVVANEMEDLLEKVEEIINSSSSAYEVLYSICLLFSESVRDGEVTVGALGSVFAPGHARTGTTIDEEIVRITRLVEVQLERGKAEGFVRMASTPRCSPPRSSGPALPGPSRRARSAPATPTTRTARASRTPSWRSCATASRRGHKAEA